MQITQYYETTVVDRKSNAEGKFIVLPRRAFSDKRLLPSIDLEEEEGHWRFEELVRELTDQKPNLISPSQLPLTVADCLARSSRDNQQPRGMDVRRMAGPPNRDQVEQHLGFAEILTLAPVVPFEQSPLSLDSVASLITKASGVGLGAYAGFVVGGASPLIFVTVPAGMIVFGAAAGVANALEQGLRLRLLRLVKGEMARTRVPQKA